ncbi:uncharacterized protein LOC111076248 [Drosophila obscura]|uniref:uncharacterized protein LOC111076248 n=1 Tax=Drosophila obscura TaxID=7282 RepID=UPI001BB1E01F|nr:uncharacterized protein LOC111076248 [Drosophila obscura]
MCCVLQHCLKTFLFVASLMMHVIIICNMLTDFRDIRNGTSCKLCAKWMKYYFNAWTLHSMCGTLLTIVKFKDLCYLQWWVLMTCIYFVAGLAYHLVLHDYQDEFYGTHEMVRNYFALGMRI